MSFDEIIDPTAEMSCCFFINLCRYPLRKKGIAAGNHTNCNELNHPRELSCFHSFVPLNGVVFEVDAQL